MRPKVLEENIDNFNAVSKNAVERMVQIRDSKGEVPDLEGELSKWSTEGKAIHSKNNYSLVPFFFILNFCIYIYKYIYI